MHPVLYKVRQRFDNSKIHDIPSEIRHQFDLVNAESIVKPGMKIAVTAGSRGISNISLIIKTVCNILKSYGAQPFIVPSMGSHGGATAEGQVYVLQKLGITEETMNVPIVSSMEVVKIGDTTGNVPVYMDANAYKSDGIVVVNRIKPHTDFNCDSFESGLLKMMAVGLGKAKGCSQMHSNGLAKTILEAAKVDLAKAPILLGLAILENSYDETYKLKAILPQDFISEEEKLFKEAKAIVPKIPTDNLDILIVYEIGKMFSGTGMDTKVIGRMRVFGEKEPDTPKINKIVVLDIAESSYGNALGIGLADLTTRKLVNKIDYKATYANTIPTTYLERSKIPMIMETDREAVQTALNTIGSIKAEDARLVVIKNTLNLEELYVSKSLLEEVKNRNVEVLEEWGVMNFDMDGNLILDWRKG